MNYTHSMIPAGNGIAIGDNFCKSIYTYINDESEITKIIKCERCDFKITKRVRLYELEHNMTLLTDSEGKN